MTRFRPSDLPASETLRRGRIGSLLLTSAFGDICVGCPTGAISEGVRVDDMSSSVIVPILVVSVGVEPVHASV